MTARIKTARARRAYTPADWNAVSDNPEWTAEEMAKAKPFAEVFPELAANARRVRGKQKAPTKQLVSLRLDRSVVEAFKAEGTGWQSRMNEALKQAAQNRQPVVPRRPGPRDGPKLRRSSEGR